MRTFPAVFDLVAGPILDKGMLAEGVRTGSMRRVAVAALIVRLFVFPAPVQWEVAAWALAVLGLDLQGAITAAPKAAMGALGEAIGRARGAYQSAYTYARSTWEPSRADPPEAS